MCAYFWRREHYFGSMGKRNGGHRNAHAPGIAARTDVLRARVGGVEILSCPVHCDCGIIENVYVTLLVRALFGHLIISIIMKIFSNLVHIL